MKVGIDLNVLSDDELFGLIVEATGVLSGRKLAKRRGEVPIPVKRKYEKKKKGKYRKRMTKKELKEFDKWLKENMTQNSHSSLIKLAKKEKGWNISNSKIIERKKVLGTTSGYKNNPSYNINELEDD